MGKSNGVYRVKVYSCGEYMDFYGYQVFQVPPSCRSGKRVRRKPTRKMQEKLNWRHAAEKLTRILNTNFTEDDLSLTLTFRENPINDEAAKKAIQKFLRKIRYRFKKLERELKYVWQLEKSKKGRYHIHMVLTGGIDRDELEKLWGNGYANSKRLQFDQHGLAALSRYIGKSCVDSEEERVTYRSYNGSKNLIDPEPEISDSKIRSRKRMQELADMDWNLWHELYPEYEVADLYSYTSEDYGGIYIFARLHRTDGKRYPAKNPPKHPSRKAQEKVQ